MATRAFLTLLAWLVLLAPGLAGFDTSKLGKPIFNSDEFKLYYRIHGDAVIFSALLPVTWSYTLNIDANKDGVWGYGPVDPKRKSQVSKVDIAYAQTTDGRLCPQFIYNAYAGNADVPYESSECGDFHSRGSMRTTLLSGNMALKIYTIPRREISAGGNSVHIVISLWDGHEFHYLETPGDPILLNI